MWNDTAKLFVAFVVLVFSTLGVSVHTSRYLERMGDSYKQWLEAPFAFTGLFIVIVLLRLGEPLTRAPIAPIFLVLSALYGLSKMFQLGCSSHFRFVKSTWYVTLPYLMFATASLFLRGGLPFSVSDAWTHTSYINRISSTDSALILGTHLPADGKFFSFSPTSIFLASVNDVIIKDPIAVWNASAAFFGLLLLCAASAFLVSLDLVKVYPRTLIIAVSALFFILYPTAKLVEGWAGYSMTGSIFLFIVLTLTVHCSVHRNSNLLMLILALISFVMSINHQVESIICLLMMIPLFVFPAISKWCLIQLIGVFGVVSAAGSLMTLRFLNSEVLVAFNFSTDWPGISSFLDRMNPFFNGRLLVSAIVSSLYLFITGRRLIVAYTAACFLTIAFLGPWNPVFSPMWVEFMSSTLMFRAVYALPIWITFGGFVACFLVDLNKVRYKGMGAKAFSLFAFVFVIAPIGLHAAEKFGFTGQMTYYGSDQQSQLSTLPDLYKKIQVYDKRVVLTDIWTGAPIPTVSSNFIVVHRPWSSGPDMNRWAEGRDAMNSLSAQSSHINLCKWDVDLVLLNQTQLPLMERQFLAAPWVLPDFYNTTDELFPEYLNKVETIGQVQVLEFDKDTCAN